MFRLPLTKMAFVVGYSRQFFNKKRMLSFHSSSCPCRVKQFVLCNIPHACAADNDEHEPMLKDFDRDYYDALKEKYADEPYVSIYSKDDYKLDPKDVPWLYDNRGRDLKEIAEKVQKRIEDRQKNPNAEGPPESEGHVNPPPNALIWTDLHTEQEISEYEERALTEDPATGRVWTTPMSRSELYNVKEQYEKPDGVPPLLFDDEEPLSKIPNDDGDEFWDRVEPPLPGNLYDEEDELLALNRSWEHMYEQAEGMRRDNGMTFGEMDLPPDPAEYERWKREAEKRGGNATVGDSHSLSPYNTSSSNEVHEEAAHSADDPPQHECLVRAHTGTWKGTATVYRLNFEDILQHSITATAPVQSEVICNDDYSLEVHCSVDRDEGEILSSTEFSAIQSGNIVCRGRGVDHDGSYVLIPPKGGFIGGGFSIGPKTLSKLTGDLKNKPVVEICIFSSQGNRTRHRVFLFANGPRPELRVGDEKLLRRESKLVHFSSILFVSEKFHDAQCLEPPQKSASPKTVPKVPLKSLLGRWSGRGTTIQPEYPLNSSSIIDTSFSMTFVDGIVESDVTWTEDQFEDDPMKPSKRKQRQEGKKKESKRTSTARKHDQKRLSVCSILSREQNGAGNVEIHPWEVLSSNSSSVPSLFSPRIGRFNPDYCGIALNESLFLTLPFQAAYPTLWNVISVMELDGPSRKRILVGRSPENLLVGALFTKEIYEDDDKGDSVAAYV